MLNLTTNKIIGIVGGVAGVVGGGTAIYLTSGSKEVKNEKDNPDTNSNKGTEQDQEKNLQPAKQATKETVTQLLNKKNKAIIQEGEAGKWSAKWATFQAAYPQAAPDGDWKIDGWNEKKGKDTGLSAFKQLCTDNSKKEVENEDAQLFKDILKYCVDQ